MLPPKQKSFYAYATDAQNSEINNNSYFLNPTF